MNCGVVATAVIGLGLRRAASPIGGAVGHAGQHFGDMAHLDRRALALQLAGHVHEAAEIAGQQRIGAASLTMFCDLVARRWRRRFRRI